MWYNIVVLWKMSCYYVRKNVEESPDRYKAGDGAQAPTRILRLNSGFPERSRTEKR